MRRPTAFQLAILDLIQEGNRTEDEILIIFVRSGIIRPTLCYDIFRACGKLLNAGRITVDAEGKMEVRDER